MGTGHSSTVDAEDVDREIRHSEAVQEAEPLQSAILQSAIFNSANFSSIATDAKGVIQIFNVGAQRMLGYTAAEVMNTITPAALSDPPCCARTAAPRRSTPRGTNCRT
jgi:PAS domain-containing protein